MENTKDIDKILPSLDIRLDNEDEEEDIRDRERRAQELQNLIEDTFANLGFEEVDSTVVSSSLHSDYNEENNYTSLNDATPHEQETEHGGNISLKTYNNRLLDIDELTKKVNELEAEKSQLLKLQTQKQNIDEKEIDSLKNDLSQMQTTMRGLQQECENLRATNAKLEKEHLHWLTRSCQLENELKEKSNETDLKTQIKERYEHEIMVLRNVLQEKDTKYELLQQEHTAVLTKLEKYNTMETDFHNEKAKMEQNVLNLMQESEKSCNQLSKRINVVTTANSNLEQALKNLQEKLNSYEEKSKISEKENLLEIEKLSNENKSLSENVIELESKLSATELALKKSQEDSKQLIDQLTYKRLQVEGLEKRCTQLQEIVKLSAAACNRDEPNSRDQTQKHEEEENVEKLKELITKLQEKLYATQEHDQLIKSLKQKAKKLELIVQESALNKPPTFDKGIQTDITDFKGQKLDHLINQLESYLPIFQAIEKKCKTLDARNEALSREARNLAFYVGIARALLTEVTKKYMHDINNLNQRVERNLSKALNVLNQTQIQKKEHQHKNYADL